MNYEQIEHHFSCPYCNADISILIDPSVASQEFIEDCEVCCNPIEFIVAVRYGNLVMFEANRLDD